MKTIETQVRLKKATVKDLIKLKIYSRETYDEIINRLIKQAKIKTGE